MNMNYVFSSFRLFWRPLIVSQQVRTITRLDKRWKDIAEAEKKLQEEQMEKQDHQASNENDFLLSVVEKPPTAAELLSQLKKRTEIQENPEAKSTIGASGSPDAVRQLLNAIRGKQSLVGTDDLIKGVSDERKDIPDEDLLLIMNELTVVTKPFREENFYAVCGIMDRCMTSRLTATPGEQGENSKFTSNDFLWSLVVAWYRLFRTKLSIFAINLTSILLKDLETLGKNNFLCLLFLLNCRRTPLTDKQAEEVQSKLLHFLPNLTTEEIAVACVSLFKTKTKMTNSKLLESILTRVSSDPTGIKPIALTCVFKNLKYGQIKEVAPLVRKFIAGWKKSDVKKLSYMGANHLLSASGNYLMFNQEIVEAAVDLISEKPDGEPRLKDMVEILRSCHEFNHDPEDSLLDQLIHDVRNNPAVEQYPYYLLVFLTLMASFEKYPDDLIQQCYHEYFQKVVHQEKDFLVHGYLLTLFSILSIECHPRYDEKKLLTENQVVSMSNSIRRNPKQVIFRLTMKPTPHASDLQTFLLRKMYHCVRDCVRESGGNLERVAFSFLLPYSQIPFLVVLPEGKDVTWINSRLLVPDSMSGSHVVNVMSVSHFSDWMQTRYRGYFTTQMRLLRKLGVTVHNLHWTDVRQRSDKDQTARLKKLLFPT